MARLQLTVVLEPVPRAWFDEAVGLYFDTYTEYFAELGDPPAAAAQYELPDGETVYLESWQRNGVTEGRSYAELDDGTVSIMTVRVDSPGNPRIVEYTTDSRGVKRSSAMFGTVRVDLPTWWDGTARDGVGPAITGTGKQAVVFARGSVSVAPARGGRWQVTVDVMLRGRGLLRPLLAPALVVGGFMAKRMIKKPVKEFARRWNEEVPVLLTKSQDELRELIDPRLTEATDS